MGCSPEQTRLNAQKSTGPKTARGKAIASRNNRKHGLLSKEPPLLASEDLETFQGLVQQLVDHYRPEGPIEWHLVQQIAMCMQKQWRVWGAEAVVGNKQVAEAVLSTCYPEKDPARGVGALLKFGTYSDIDDRAVTHPDILREEKDLLTQLKDCLEYWSDCPKSNGVKTWETWLMATDPALPEDPQTNYAFVTEAIAEGIATCLENYPDAARPKGSERGNHYLFSIAYLKLLYSQAPTPGSEDWVGQVQELKESTDTTLKAVNTRLEKIDHALTHIDTLTKQTQQQHPLPESLQLISRYEAHVNRQLTQALDKLRELQAERKNAGSSSSNGKELQLKAV